MRIAIVIGAAILCGVLGLLGGNLLYGGLHPSGVITAPENLGDVIRSREAAEERFQGRVRWSYYGLLVGVLVGSIGAVIKTKKSRGP